MTLNTDLWKQQADGSFLLTGQVDGKTPDLTLEVNGGAMQEQNGGDATQAVFLLNTGG